MRKAKNRAYTNESQATKKGTERAELEPGTPDLTPMVKCGRCGRQFRYIKQRKTGEKRYTTCPGCGTSYSKTLAEIEELNAKSVAMGRPVNMR